MASNIFPFTPRVRQCATILPSLPAKICQPHLFTLVSYWVKEWILVSGFLRLAHKKWYGFSFSFTKKCVLFLYRSELIMHRPKKLLSKLVQTFVQFCCYPCFGLIVLSPVGFKARVGSLICNWQGHMARICLRQEVPHHLQFLKYNCKVICLTCQMHAVCYGQKRISHYAIKFEVGEERWIMYGHFLWNFNAFSEIK